MKRFLIASSVLLAAFLLSYCGDTNKNTTEGEIVEGVAEGGEDTATTDTYRFPSYCPDFPPPPGTDVFELSQDYPTTYDKNDKQPWMDIDFKTDYKAYMQAVLDYCLEGNIDVDFKAQNNQTRKWYHAPWMHHDNHHPDHGREYLRGLTKEIDIPPGTLHSKQTTEFQTWAIAFYNPHGGVTIGKVWEKPFSPDLRKSDFPDGTVTFKLLFTEATLEEVPFLEGAKEWMINMYPTPKDTFRVDKNVRLLQLDVAIKDKRAVETGWIFGTFIYDASQDGQEWKDRMVPVGLMWGDDSRDTTMMNRDPNGEAFINPSLKQSVINQYLVQEKGKTYPAKQAYVTHHGLGGRMNGPVDNPVSSCISCHGRAAVNLETGATANMANFGQRYNYTLEDFNEYFHKIPCGVEDIKQHKLNKETGKVDTLSYTTADYSYQIALGVHNFMYFHQDHKEKNILEDINEDAVHTIRKRDGSSPARIALPE